jgi:hypothetical protein
MTQETCSGRLLGDDGNEPPSATAAKRLDGHIQRKYTLSQLRPVRRRRSRLRFIPSTSCWRDVGMIADRS